MAVLLNATTSPQVVLLHLAVALGLGLFVGLEREYSHAEESEQVPAGLRTYALLSLLGAVAAYLSALGSAWVLPVAGLAVVALDTVAYVEARRARADGGGLGLTSEVAAILTFLLGALAMLGQLQVAVVTTVAATVVLHMKKPLHDFVRHLGQEDMLATLKFAVVTLIILPVLPNHAYGPYEAFNPFHTWLFVSLIAGIGFLGYVLTKTIGAERGIPLTGLVGGLASSTAVTVANARRSREAEALSLPLALGTMLACMVMVPRVALIVAMIDAPLLPVLGKPLAVMLVASLCVSWALSHKARQHQQTDAESQAEHTNPFELEPALKFAVAFAVVTFLVKMAKAHEAHRGIYLISGLSGLVDADAIAVSLGQQAKDGGVDVVMAARGIMLALIVNSLVKGGFAWSLGSRRLGRQVLLGMLAVAVIAAVATFVLT